MEKNSAKRTVDIAAAAIFAAMVSIATMIFVVNIPATSGYFNIGEIVIYIAALLFGPLVGSIAGGIGAAIADMLVAPQFAPGTLVIKGIEGAIVGFLKKKRSQQTAGSNWRIYTILLGVVVGILLAAVGSIYYQKVDLYLGIPSPPNPTSSIAIPVELWYSSGAVVASLIALAGLKTQPELGRAILAIIIGGLEMVAGYFLYEQIILGKTVAIVEVAANIVQMLVGLVIAIPVAKIILRTLPQLKSRN